MANGAALCEIEEAISKLSALLLAIYLHILHENTLYITSDALLAVCELSISAIASVVMKDAVFSYSLRRSNSRKPRLGDGIVEEITFFGSMMTHVARCATYV